MAAFLPNHQLMTEAPWWGYPGRCCLSTYYVLGVKIPLELLDSSAFVRTPLASGPWFWEWEKTWGATLSHSATSTSLLETIIVFYQIESSLKFFEVKWLVLSWSLKIRWPRVICSGQPSQAGGWILSSEPVRDSCHWIHEFHLGQSHSFHWNNIMRIAVFV